MRGSFYKYPKLWAKWRYSYNYPKYFWFALSLSLSLSSFFFSANSPHSERERERWTAMLRNRWRRGHERTPSQLNFLAKLVSLFIHQLLSCFLDSFNELNSAFRFVHRFIAFDSSTSLQLFIKKTWYIIIRRLIIYYKHFVLLR